MLVYSRDHVISILESGLLFKEDCVEVEQEAPSEQAVWAAAGGGGWGWMTRGERWGGAALVLACLLACPPRDFQRSTLLRVGACALLPVGMRALHRRRCRGRLGGLLALMLRYVTLARRAAAVCREYAALHAGLGSLSAVIESTHTMLCRQQSSLAVLMSRASSAILGNAPWLRDDLAWDHVPAESSENLLKIHHAFLVVQSTLLKHVAMAHFPPPAHSRGLYRNHNERVHWLHSVLLQHLSEEFAESLAALERMYRLLKNYGSRGPEARRPGPALTARWLYSDVHNDVARAGLELKLAATKCDSIDVFLDACAATDQPIDPLVLGRDLEELIDALAKCLATAQSSRIRLGKLSGRLAEPKEAAVEAKREEDPRPLVQIGDREPEPEDEVFYFVRTDGDEALSPAGDVTTGPGPREREATKVVLNELKRKLVKREDAMRERERRALEKTMPQLGTVPEFPRQTQPEEVEERRGFISKVRSARKRDASKCLNRRNMKHSARGHSVQVFGRGSRFRLKLDYYTRIEDIPGCVCEANARLDIGTVLITLVGAKNSYCVIKWCRKTEKSARRTESINPPNEADHMLREPVHNGPEAFRVSKEELELSSSGSEAEFDLVERNEILEDLRRHRARRGVVVRRGAEPKDLEPDESLRPMEYSLGTGLAMASVLQINRAANRPNMAEEEFVGDGEVSEDSGHDDE
ncbi:unnamed protein product, partial [Iphiclides podalirius]